MQETRVWSVGREDPLEKQKATQTSNLAWEIPWTEEPGGLQSTVRQESRAWQQQQRNITGPGGACTAFRERTESKRSMDPTLPAKNRERMLRVRSASGTRGLIYGPEAECTSRPGILRLELTENGDSSHTETRAIESPDFLILQCLLGNWGHCSQGSEFCGLNSQMIFLYLWLSCSNPVPWTLKLKTLAASLLKYPGQILSQPTLAWRSRWILILSGCLKEPGHEVVIVMVLNGMGFDLYKGKN